MNHVRMRVALAVVTTATLAIAAVALAVTTPIDDVDLEAAGGDAIFDAENYGDECGPSGDGECFFTPVSDGSAFGNSDAFDEGLVLGIEGQSFVDDDDEGDLTGQQLTVGPVMLAGLQVTRIERALAGSPTLRTLVKLKNTKRKKSVRRRIILSSDLGSDSGTTIRRSSSGDVFFNPADRWMVSSDDPTTADLGDPPVTFVTYGKGKPRVKPLHAALLHGRDDLTASYSVRLARKRTAYLMFFTELSETNESAISGTSKFNAKKLNASLKDGLSKKIQKKILNWDLAKKKGKKNR
jgi:hypothetical protein